MRSFPPLVLPHGGFGLGNDLIPLGKAYLISEECGGRLLDISWRENKRNYQRYFRSSWFDPLLRRLLWKSLPRIAFPVDYGGAAISNQIKEFCNQHSLYNHDRPILITVTGISGGPETVYLARDYILHRLLGTRHTLRNLRTIKQSCDNSRKLIVGIHARLGDFWEIGERSYAGVVNTKLPLAWYINIVEFVRRHFRHFDLQFLVASDDPSSDFVKSITSESTGVVISRLPNSDISDLIALSQCDLLICSSSTYSMWAAFLGSCYYVWYKPNLVLGQGGYSVRLAMAPHAESMLSSDPTVVGANSCSGEVDGCLDATLLHLGKTYRGYPVDDDGILPQHLMASLWRRLSEKDPSVDLVRGGVFPIVF